VKFILKTDAFFNDTEVYASLYLSPEAKAMLLHYERRVHEFMDQDAHKPTFLESMSFWRRGVGMVGYIEGFNPRNELNSEQRVHLVNSGWVRLPTDYTMAVGEAIGFPNKFHADGTWCWWSGRINGTDVDVKVNHMPWDALRCPIHGLDDTLASTCMHCVAMGFT
jgi:hypothetical protein